MGNRILLVFLMFLSSRATIAEPLPNSSSEELERLQRTQQFLTELHESMHRIREATNEDDRNRLAAEQLRLLQVHLISHGSGANQEHIQELTQRSIDSRKNPQ